MWLRNAKGDLPLHEAAASGRRELVLWLLDQRPKHVNTTSNDGRTILHIAAGNDYTDMCKVNRPIGFRSSATCARQRSHQIDRVQKGMGAERARSAALSIGIVERRKILTTI